MAASADVAKEPFIYWDESELNNGAWHAFVWENGKMTDLGKRGASSTAVDINERAQIVGASNNRAVIWTVRQ